MLRQIFKRSSHFIPRSCYSTTSCLHMPVITIEVPTMGDSITEGTVVDIPVEPPMYVKADDVVLVLETDKVSVDVRSPHDGVVTDVMAAMDDVVEVGAPLFTIDTDAKESDANRTAPHVLQEGPATDTTDLNTSVPKENERNATSVTTSTSSSSNNFENTTTGSTSSSSSSNTSKVSGGSKESQMNQKENQSLVEKSTPSHRQERRVKMSRMRQRVATRLKDAQNTAAMLTTFQEVDMGNLMELRSKHKDAFFEKHGVKLGFMSAFVKASTAALMEIPAVNAYLDDVTKEIVYNDYCDVSVAVASPNGLVVPVLRNTESMSFADVEKGILQYAKKAKEGSLALEDMAGGTFTISNGGVFGSLMGTPILNPPQSAILGMHATKMRPVVLSQSNEIVARPMMYMALTYDHRLIDGREGVTFLKIIKEHIEDPSRLLLEL